jgi:hypothetical protein
MARSGVRSPARRQTVTLELADGSEHVAEGLAAAPIEFAMRVLRDAEARGKRVVAIRVCGVRAPRTEAWAPLCIAAASSTSSKLELNDASGAGERRLPWRRR